MHIGAHARGVIRMPSKSRLKSIYDEAFAVSEEQAADEESYPDREPSPPATPLNIFQRSWSIGLPHTSRSRTDSIASISSLHSM